MCVCFYFVYMCMHVDVKPGTNIIVIAVVTSVLVFILVTTVVTVVVFVVRKKKHSKKEQQTDVPDHTYESISLSAEPVASYPGSNFSGYEVTATANKNSATHVGHSEEQVVQVTTMILLPLRN